MSLKRQRRPSYRDYAERGRAWDIVLKMLLKYGYVLEDQRGEAAILNRCRHAAAWELFSRLWRESRRNRRKRLPRR